MPVNLAKFKKDLERELKKAGDDFLNKISNEDKTEVGEAVISEMKSLIKKGISPIADVGRFPAYKWAGAANTLRALTKNLPKGRRKAAREKLDALKRSKYPYNVQKEFPNKRERPVNLYLGGEFLDDLEPTPTRNGVSIGFSSKLSQEKERGHREGANGQPERPIIPQGREQFSPSIYRRIVDIVQKIVQKKIRT